jgi:hypothetical protein
MTHPTIRSTTATAGQGASLVENGASPSWPAYQLVVGCAAAHLIAAAIVYRDLIPNLYEIFDANPRLLVLEHGLARLTALMTFLPPVVPTLLILGAAGWVGAARREREVGRWLALALLPLAADSALRALGVVIAPPAEHPAELFDLPSRFSPGPRMLADLLGFHPRGVVMYWLVVWSFAAMTSVYCVARALRAAEDAALDPLERLRRQRRGNPFGSIQALIVSAGTLAGITAVGQFALPTMMQLLLRLLG